MLLNEPSSDNLNKTRRIRSHLLFSLGVGGDQGNGELLLPTAILTHLCVPRGEGLGAGDGVTDGSKARTTVTTPWTAPQRERSLTCRGILL